MIFLMDCKDKEINILTDKTITLPTIRGNLSVLDKVTVFLLALSPILQHYKGIIYNAGITALAILLPYLIIKIFITRKLQDYPSTYPVLWFVVYYLYRIVDHGTNLFDLSQNIVPLILIVVFAMGGIDLKYFRKITLMIALSASIMIVFQSFFFYVLGFHLQLVPTDLLLPQSEQWVLGAQTGLAGITGKIGNLYRPSAFFLEPSHMFLYLFPHLLLSLFSRNTVPRKNIIALLITIGLLLSTSGMAIGVLFGAWFVYFILYNKRTHKISIKTVLITKNIINFIVLIVLLIVLYFNVPFIQASISRIITGSAGSVSAISGRTTRGVALIRNLAGAEFWFGVSDNIVGINFNLSGLVATMYKYGIIGVVLSYMFFFQVLRKLDIPYVLMSGVIIVISLFSAHTHGTFYMLYYVCLLMGGYQTRILARTGSRWLASTRRKRNNVFLY